MVKYGRRKRRSVRRRRRTRRRAVKSRVSRRRLQGVSKSTFTKTAAALVGTGVYNDVRDLVDAATRKRYRRPGSNTRRKFPRMESTGAYNQWSQRYAQARLGKLTLRKIIKNTTDELRLVWQKIDRFGNDGTIKMTHTNTTLATPTTMDLPLVCVELNSSPNVIAGTVTNHAPVCFLRKTIANGSYTWVNIQGQTTTGVPNINWQIERSPGLTSAVTSYPNDCSILKWVQAELELHGMRNYPTKWTIELCKFSEYVTPNQTPGTAITDGNYCEFWDNMLKPYTYSPLSQLVPGFKKKQMTILKRYNVDIDPTASFENDANPHIKTFRMFFRMNRKCSYDWAFTNAAAQPQADFEDVDYKQEDGDNNTQVDPKARIFLLMRATNFQAQTDPAAATDVNTPMMNMRIRASHLINS